MNEQNHNAIDYDYIEGITITTAITFVLKHPQKENKSSLM